MTIGTGTLCHGKVLHACQAQLAAGLLHPSADHGELLTLNRAEHLGITFGLVYAATILGR